MRDNGDSYNQIARNMNSNVSTIRNICLGITYKEIYGVESLKYNLTGKKQKKRLLSDEKSLNIGKDILTKIYQMYRDCKKFSVIARHVSIRKSIIKRIIHGEIYKDEYKEDALINGAISPRMSMPELTYEDICRILESYILGFTLKSIADEYGINFNYIKHLTNNTLQRYKESTERYEESIGRIPKKVELDQIWISLEKLGKKRPDFETWNVRLPRRDEIYPAEYLVQIEQLTALDINISDPGEPILNLKDMSEKEVGFFVLKSPLEKGTNSPLEKNKTEEV